MPLLFSTLSPGPTTKTAPVRVPHHAASFHEQLPQLSPFSHVQIHSMLLLPPQQQHSSRLQHLPVNKQHSVQWSPRKSASSPTKQTVFCVPRPTVSWTDSQHSSSPGMEARRPSPPPSRSRHEAKKKFSVSQSTEATRHHLEASLSTHQEWKGRLNFHLVHRIVHDPIPECNITYSRASFAREDCTTNAVRPLRSP